MPIKINKYVGVVSGQNASAVSNVPDLYLTNSMISDNLVPGDKIGEFFLSDRSSEDFELVNTVDGAFEIVGGNVLIVGPEGVPDIGGVYTLVIRAGGVEYQATVTVVKSLQELTLSNYTFPENSPSGTVIGQVLGVRPGSTLEIFPSDDRVTLNSSNELLVGVVESPRGGFDIGLQETNPTAPNSPRLTPITVIAVGPLPILVDAPVITGDLIEGGVLSVSNGVWQNDPTSYTYQWYLDGVAQAGQTSQTFTLPAGPEVTAVVTAHNDAGAVPAASQAVQIEFVTYNAENVTYLGSNVTYPAGGY